MNTPAPEIRTAIRDLLLSSDAYHRLHPDHRRQIAQGLVKVCHTAAALAQEETQPTASPARAPVAMAQATAGSQFSGVATDKVASTPRNILNAVSFPRFVTELINGVFK